MLSKLQKATDNAKRILFNNRHRIDGSFFSLFSRNQVTMVQEQTSSSSSTSSSKVQALYELCNKTFTPSQTSPPSSQAVNKLCSLMDTIGPSDVGLKEENPDDDRGHGFFGLQKMSRVARWAQPITFIDVFECNNFTICIFLFPTSSVIPLHDHPGMTVFSKVLYGSLHVKAYDWVEPACIHKIGTSGNPPVRLAKSSVDKVLMAPCETSVLYPKNGGNLHCFTAVTPCAVLDVLAPPYREDLGRRCTYYHDNPYDTFSAGNGAEIDDGKVDDYAWLSEIETPDDLYMRSGLYSGPAIHVEDCPWHT